VNQLNPSVQSPFDVLASELQSRLLPGHTGDVGVSWGGDSTDRTSPDLIWWSWSLSIDSACRVLAGASLATWQKISGIDADAAADDLPEETLAAFKAAIEETTRRRFGSEVTCSVAERSEAPPHEWTSARLAVTQPSGTDMSVHLTISPDLETALSGASTNMEGSEQQDRAPRLAATRNSVDILMHVEMPVSIVLGRTKMRLQDLLKLTNGSVVELDQLLDDEVEIRVSNCVIAYGEVVAVDGNYAVRILRMAPARNTPNLRGALPEKAA
jgi:flagellar motor switch protein FliN